MEFKTFFKSQMEIAEYLNKIINEYWAGTISEEKFISNVKN